MAASPDISEPNRDVAAQFGVEFDYPDTYVIDHHLFDRLSDTGAHTRIISSEFSSQTAIIESVSDAPVLFEGIGHATTKNPLCMRILSAPSAAYSYERAAESGKIKPMDEDPVIAGTEIGLVSATQALNNARAVFIGSLAFFSDEFFDASVEVAPIKDGELKRYERTANKVLAQELSSWAFQEKSVLKAIGARHFHTSTGLKPDYYSVSEGITFELDTAEYRDGAWRTFVADDVQLEFTMLDPYVRITMTPKTSGSDEFTTLVANFTAPDTHGMFTFRVNYKRFGKSYLLFEEVVSVRPLRHDEFPRFLSIAWPYYVSAGSMTVAFVVFSAVWMWNREPNSNKRRE